MRVLVVGGAGYIGSHMVKMLGATGHDVMTYDNLSSGHRDAVLFGTFVEGDLADSARLGDVLATGFDAVMHFGTTEALKPWRQALARRDGPILPLITHEAETSRLILERHICIDTTASGGNAELLAKAAGI